MPDLDLVCIGNALVDVSWCVSDEFLVNKSIVKGGMTLINDRRADQLFEEMGKEKVVASGGSAANTAFGFKSFGGDAGYIGCVNDDTLGHCFIEELQSIGIHYTVAPFHDGPKTGRCLVYITPDSQRSMCTFLGASACLRSELLDQDIIRQSKIILLEGYLFDAESAREAYYTSAAVAHAAHRKVALNLSDSHCVARHRSDFIQLVRKGVDILFANESEIIELYNVSTFDEAVDLVRYDCDIACLTRGSQGSVIISNHKMHEIAPAVVDNVIDSTGAGDQYAAGVLYGFTHGYSVEDSGRLGSLAAAEVITHFGPRAQVSLSDILNQL